MKPCYVCLLSGFVSAYLFRYAIHGYLSDESFLLFMEMYAEWGVRLEERRGLLGKY